ncbi:MAG: winged helix-turn-helix domain-containing protein [Alphaproteobacteria bacterium]|nr:winged helix-turn-helix domain-containing protein [Alphaproteobacteria bacterium]
MDSAVAIGTHTLDLVRGRLDGPGTAIPLTQLEALFLAYLARRTDTVVPKDELLREVWGYAANVRSRAVDATLVRMRSKLEGTGIAIDVLWGRGLQLSVDAPAPVIAPAAPSLPGREEVLGALAPMLEVPGLVSLWGPPGVGKTAVARALPGVWMLVGEGERSIEQELCTRLGCAPAEIPVALARARPRLAVDDAEARTSGELELLRGWAEHTGVLLIGTRRRPGRADLRLEPLGAEAATAMLAALTEQPAAQCAPLVAHTDGLPRQIELLAQAVRFVGPEAAAELGAGAFPAMEAAVGVLWAGLDDGERAVLGAVSIFRDRFDLVAAARVADTTPHAVLPVLQRLYELSLLQGDRGVFRLLAPVRVVASRYRPEGVQQRFEAFCRWLLEDNARGGDRWRRHLADLLDVLRTAEGALAAEVGVMCVEASIHAGAEADLGAQHGPERRPLVIALMLTTHALHGRFDEAQRLLPLIAEPLADPAAEVVRRAALRRWDPDAPPFEALASRVSVALYAAAFTLAAATGWVPPVDACLHLAALGEQAGYVAVARAMYTYSSAAARRAGDPAWLDLGRRGGLECRVVVELRRGDVARAAEVAAALLDVERDHILRLELAGMLALALLLDDRRPEALEVVDRYGRSPVAHYLQLAALVLGRADTLADPARQGWIESWRRGETVEPGPLHNDARFVYSLVLSRLVAP